MLEIKDNDQLNSLLEEKEMAVLYFSNEACNVCKVLKPKIKTLLEEHFPKVQLVFIDTEHSPLIAGQHTVFSIPTVDIFVQGKQHARFSRNIALFEFEEALSRPYELIFSE